MSEIQDKTKGYICNHCGLFVKSYRRSFNSNMGIALLYLYKYGGGKFVHMENFLQSKGLKRCGDFSYLRFYGLIERYEGTRKDGSNRNGHYKITGRGIAFAENKLTVNQYFIIFNNACEGFVGKDISITDALGEKFDYTVLMQGTDKVTVRQHERNSNKSCQSGKFINQQSLFDTNE